MQWVRTAQVVGSPCPSAEEWIKNMCYMHTMEFCPAVKKDIWLVVATWMTPEDVLLSETSQACSHLCVESKRIKLITAEENAAFQGLGREEEWGDVGDKV